MLAITRMLSHADYLIHQLTEYRLEASRRGELVPGYIWAWVEETCDGLGQLVARGGVYGVLAKIKILEILNARDCLFGVIGWR